MNTYTGLLKKNADFRRLWFAQLVSLGGDWFNLVALQGLVLELTGSGVIAAVALAANMVPHFVFSPVSGVVADRFDRKKLMILSDVARIILALMMLFVRTPQTVWLGIFAMAGIATFGAFFTPASNAALPNLVSKEELGPANVLMGASWGTMLAIGAALGGVVAAAFGRDAAFIVNAATFAVSALLVVRVRGRFSEAQESERRQAHPARDFLDGLQYARSHPKVLALLATKAGFGTGAGVIVLLTIFGSEVFGRGDFGIGLLYGARGVGALLGPLVARAWVRDNQRRLFLAIGGAMALYGVSYAIFPAMPVIWLAAAMATIAHLGGGAQWVLSTYALQAIVPDRVRGRIFSFDFGLVTLTISASLLLAGRLAETFGPHRVMFSLALLEIVWAVVFTRATRRFWKKGQVMAEGEMVSSEMPEELFDEPLPKGGGNSAGAIARSELGEDV